MSEATDSPSPAMSATIDFASPSYRGGRVPWGSTDGRESREVPIFDARTRQGPLRPTLATHGFVSPNPNRSPAVKQAQPAAARRSCCRARLR